MKRSWRGLAGMAKKTRTQPIWQNHKKKFLEESYLISAQPTLRTVLTLQAEWFAHRRYASGLSWHTRRWSGMSKLRGTCVKKNNKKNLQTKNNKVQLCGTQTSNMTWEDAAPGGVEQYDPTALLWRQLSAAQRFQWQKLHHDFARSSPGTMRWHDDIMMMTWDENGVTMRWIWCVWNVYGVFRMFFR